MGRRSILRLLVPLAPVLLPGCAAGLVAAGAAGTYGVMKYVENEASRAYPASLRATYDATLAALPRLGYPRPHVARLGPSGGRVEAGCAKVWLECHPQGMTLVRIRVGAFETAESQRLAGLLLERIGLELGARRVPPTPTPARGPP